MLTRFRKTEYMDYEQYERKIGFLEMFHFQQDTRKRSMKEL